MSDFLKKSGDVSLRKRLERGVVANSGKLIGVTLAATFALNVGWVPYAGEKAVKRHVDLLNPDVSQKQSSLVQIGERKFLGLDTERGTEVYVCEAGEDNFRAIVDPKEAFFVANEAKVKLTKKYVGLVDPDVDVCIFENVTFSTETLDFEVKGVKPVQDENCLQDAAVLWSWIEQRIMPDTSMADPASESRKAGMAVTKVVVSGGAILVLGFFMARFGRDPRNVARSFEGQVEAMPSPEPHA